MVPRGCGKTVPAGFPADCVTMVQNELTRNEPTAPALLIRGLSKSYRQGFWGKRGRPAVCDLELTVGRGEVVALLGHNGAGKTTTLKAVLGLVRPDGGQIEICGLDASRPAARACVGYLPESPQFHQNLTATELLDYYGRLLGLDRTRRRERIADCLQMVGMDDARNRRLSECSKGMRQRVGLAQALLGEPDLLILDEPQSGLDPLGRREVKEILLAQRARGVAVLFSSHIVPDVEAVADRVAVLERGRLAEIKDLQRRGPARGFKAWIAAPPARLATTWLAAHDLRVAIRADGRWLVETAAAGALGRFLSACDSHKIAVYDVQAAGTGLEDDLTDGREAVARETAVAPC